MRHRRFTALLLLVPLSLHAQKRPDTSTVLAFRFFARHYGDLLVAAFDSIPESKYGFHPTPPQQTIGYIAQHVENANWGLCGRLGTATHAESAKDRLPDTTKAHWPKDTLVARLKASLAFCDSAMAKLDDAKLEQHVAFGAASANMRELPSRALLAFVTDLAEHYSQLSAYMRAMTMTPPSALGSSGRAITLSPSALQPFVGTYDLPASAWQDAPAIMLDVTLENGALRLTPRGRTGVRLWPSSPTEFFIKEVDAQVTFTRDRTGRATQLVLHQNGEDRVARKVK